MRVERPLLVWNAVTASSPLWEMVPVVVTAGEVVEVALDPVPMRSSTLVVAAPLHSLSCSSELAPALAVPKATEVMPEGALARYQISTGPLVPRHTDAARTQPVGAEKVVEEHPELRSVTVATSRLPAVELTGRVAVTVVPPPDPRGLCCTRVMAADAWAAPNTSTASTASSHPSGRRITFLGVWCSVRPSVGMRLLPGGYALDRHPAGEI